MKHGALIIFLLAFAASAFGAAEAIPGTGGITTTATNTDQMIIQTNSAGSAGQKFTRSINLSNLIEVLKAQSNFPVGSGDAGGTNARQFGSAVLSNLIATVSDNVTNILEGNKLYVRTNGSDSTGTRGRMDKPFLTLLAARDASKPGDLVDVGPGTYNERRWATNMRNWYFHPGSVVTNYDTNGNLGGWGLVDDRDSGAITSTIGGYGVFYMSISPGSTNGMGAFVTTNPLSKITVRGKRIEIDHAGSGVNENTGISAIHQRHGTNFFFFDEIIDPFFDGIPYEEEEMPFVHQSGADGVYWEAGDLYVHAPKIRAGGYAFYAAEPAAGATNNCWIETDEISSYFASTLYNVGQNTSTGYRTWIRAKEVRKEGSTGGFGTISLYGGKFYLEAEKIGATNETRPIILTDNASTSQEAWISAQKISSGNRWVEWEAGKLHLSVDHYEDTGAVDYGFRLKGGFVELLGGVAKVRNGHAIEHLAGTNLISGLTIDTTGTNASHATATNNRPVTIAASGLTIQSTTLISPTNGASGIFATNAQTVVVDGPASMNVGPNTHVTIAGRTNWMTHVYITGNQYVSGNITNSGSVGIANDLYVADDVTVQSGLLAIGSIELGNGTTNDRVAIITGSNTNISSHPNVTIAELSHLDGATGGVQTNIDARIPIQSGAGNNTTITNLFLPATNGNHVLLKTANSNAVPITNIVGVTEMVTGTPIFWNANFANSFSVSNRVTAATTIVITNTAQEQEIMGRLIGEASGGAARVITVVANLGTLVANLDTFGTALATSASFTLTNGNAVTFYWTIGKRNGTNVAEFVSRQYAF